MNTKGHANDMLIIGTIDTLYSYHRAFAVFHQNSVELDHPDFVQMYDEYTIYISKISDHIERSFIVKDMINIISKMIINIPDNQNQIKSDAQTKSEAQPKSNDVQTALECLKIYHDEITSGEFNGDPDVLKKIDYYGYYLSNLPEKIRTHSMAKSLIESINKKIQNISLTPPKRNKSDDFQIIFDCLHEYDDEFATIVNEYPNVLEKIDQYQDKIADFHDYLSVLTENVKMHIKIQSLIQSIDKNIATINQKIKNTSEEEDKSVANDDIFIIATREQMMKYNEVFRMLHLEADKMIAIDDSFHGKMNEYMEYISSIGEYIKEDALIKQYMDNVSGNINSILEKYVYVDVGAEKTDECPIDLSKIKTTLSQARIDIANAYHTMTMNTMTRDDYISLTNGIKEFREYIASVPTHYMHNPDVSDKVIFINKTIDMMTEYFEGTSKR
jgi:hypothetical protein